MTIKKDTKACEYCKELIVRKTLSQVQWELQKTHKKCRGAYDRQQNEEYHKLRKAKRFFRKNGQPLMTI